MGEAVLIVIMLSCWIAPFFLIGLSRWGWMFIFIAAVFGLFELFAKLKNGKTLSRRFWDYSLANPFRAWLTLFFMLIGWSILLIHLAWKMLI